jgi:predicted DNA-binding protein
MFTITINLETLTEKAEKYLEKELTYLKKITKKSKEYHIREALISYVEDMEDMRDIKEYEKRKKAGKVKYYTGEEVRKELKEYYDAKEAKEKLKEGELRSKVR